MKNEEMMTAGFRILLKTLVPYIITELKAHYGSDWWRQGVSSRLFNDQYHDYPENGTDEELKKAFDVTLTLRTIDLNWQIFKRKLPKPFRSWLNETLDFRNKHAHQSLIDFSNDEAARALEDMALMCDPIDNAATNELQKMVRLVRYGSEEGSVMAKRKVVVVRKAVPTPQSMSAGSMRPWREVMAPHPDVSEGRYKNAEFAADLAQVIQGSAPFEYQDPVEFFGRTYLTSGIKALLVKSLKQVAGLDGGDPVVELKTAFGGGKTHTMLALYHLFNGKIRLSDMPEVRKVVASAELPDLPKARIAVLVGTALNPNNVKRPADLPGITIHTMWGEMVYQLAKSMEDPSLYNLVKESDAKGVSPGSATFQQIFNRCGHTLILIDELVAYGRKLNGVKGLPAGTFENFLSFIQELTEAASATKGCLLVTSIPESDNEIGGESGQKVLDALSHYFERKESIWQPVESNEGFEVVRRRLFGPCADPMARDAVCEAFGKMYREDPLDFPVKCRDIAYIQRMKDCYPIHPEVFDQLYDDWATLEKFQRTRGVLRLMAAVINNLWESDDQSLMIMPASLAIGSGNVKMELLRYLSPEWNSIVDSEIDGKKARSVELDKLDARFGSAHAAQKVARTLFFGTAPQAKAANKGVSQADVMLGCMQPGGNVSVYRDALTMLASKLSYLYSSGKDSYWFDVRPTLRKLMEDKASRIENDTAYDEIQKQLQSIPRGHLFGKIHIAPHSSLDIPEEDSVRLVLLSPRISYSQDQPDYSGGAKSVVADYLYNHGQSPRVYKNMLAFAFVDSASVKDLLDETKRSLAWQEINQDEASKENYTKTDLQTIRNGIEQTRQHLFDRMKSAYSWMIVPKIFITDPTTINLTPIQIGGTDDIVTRIENKMIQDEAIVTHYAPGLLMMVLNQYFFQDNTYIQCKDLWKAFCSYCYMPRLKDYSVLERCITDGVSSDEYFALADGVNGDGTFTGIKFHTSVAFVEQSLFLVRKDKVPHFSPAVLKEILETHFFREGANHIQVKALWDACNTDPELPKLKDFSMLAQTIREGVSSDQYFALADGIDEHGDFVGLTFNQEISSVPQDHLIVRIQDAIRQKAVVGGTSPFAMSKPQTRTPRRFYLSQHLDKARATKDFSTIVQEILTQIWNVKGNDCTIKIEVDASFPNGEVTPAVKRNIEENCHTLKIDDYGFDD